MKQTTDITGSDAQRLADCIKFAGDNGLTINGDTQCGVNPSSGNVWLWDEDWSACIYQNIGFDGPCFSLGCSNCGEEHDFETLGQIDDYIEIYGYSQCEFCEKDQ